jgi:hypothetical protein
MAMANGDDHTFIPYPDIENDDFYDRIFAKKEFNKTAYSSDFRYKTSEELCTRGEFKMQNHQEFIRNFISSETPYNGALLFHGTGVGKTCAAIGTTEGLRDYVKRDGKIYILSSENIRPNFYKELYDPGREAVERELHGMAGSYQCAGDRYYPVGVADSGREAAANALIKQYYAFYGFGAFANFVDIGLGAKLPSHINEPKITNEDGTLIDIGDYFANSVIVIDEAHGIAGETKRMSKDEFAQAAQEDEQEDDASFAPAFQDADYEASGADFDFGRRSKKAITSRSLLQVLLHSIIPACLAKGNKLKLILLTATPMKDNIQELADLLQLLNVNDGRMAPSDNDWRFKYFPKMTSDEIGTQITDEMIDGIKILSRGYVSYVKSNNPITFPKPLNPPQELLYEPARDGNGQIRPMFPYRSKDTDLNMDISSGYDIRLPNDTPFRFDLVKCPMSLYHFKCYIAQLSGRQTIERKTDSSDTHTRMASNFVFPHPDMNRFIAGSTLTNPQNVYGNKGFDACFRKQTSETADNKKFTFYQYTPQAISIAGNFLKQGENGLEKYSKKFDIFLDCVNNGSKGVVYAYSEFVKAGALMGAMVLEANGYVRFTPNLKNHLDKITGLPVKNIEKVYPQSHILHLTGDNARVPQTHYRCALCGKVYDKCRSLNKDDHPFKIATYILVTAAIGNISDIAEATNGNQDGSKIRVVMGTKTTGQGVDFKWVRQVHILDPWHNNTRIYQAIGRGLRHCSHADLPASERDVTIYKYASTPATIDMRGHEFDEEVVEVVDDNGVTRNLNLTYRDFYTETVDEHMYQRVVRKDLVIKQIERVLKIVAVDCELNRMRNQFPSDIDYSRECDYTLCKYSCDGFVTPIKYIRKIRKDTRDSTVKWYVVDDNEDAVIKDNLWTVSHLLNLVPLKRQSFIKSNEDLWKELKKAHHLVTLTLGAVEELIVDVPLIEIDNSTYDIYFSTPQVDRALKLITRIYQKSIALTMEKLIFLVKQTEPTMEDQFVYMAMDKLVGNPPNIKPLQFVDRYGRNGYVVYHNGYYIYQPLEIKDKTTPLFYRMRPLDIKRRFYNMDQLAPKPKAVTYAVSTMNTSRLDEIIDTYMSRTILSVLNLLDMFRILNTMMLSEHKYIVETVINTVYTSDRMPTNGYLYIIEYYLRTGLLIFRGWKKTHDDLDRLLNRKDHDMTPLHFISADGNVRVYERLSGGWSWKSADLTDIRGDLPESDNARFYPSPPTFNRDPTVAKPVFPNLNINDDNDGIYAFRSTNVTRNNKPIINSGELPEVMVNVVQRLGKNYPDTKSMGLNSFKVVDETTKQETITKASTSSGRTKLRGLACLSAQETTTKPQIERVFTAINDNFGRFIKENLTVQEFWQQAELGNLRDRKALCIKLEKLMMIADYYYIGGVKWNLNTLETEFYRPSVIKD